MGFLGGFHHHWNRAVPSPPLKSPRASGGARVGGVAAKAGLWEWIGAPTGSGAPHSGAPGQGPVEEPASGGLRMAGTAAKTGLWEWIGAPTASGAPPAGALGLGPVEEPASGRARGGGTAAEAGLTPEFVEEAVNDDKATGVSKKNFFKSRVHTRGNRLSTIFWECIK